MRSKKPPWFLSLTYEVGPGEKEHLAADQNAPAGGEGLLLLAARGRGLKKKSYFAGLLLLDFGKEVRLVKC